MPQKIIRMAPRVIRAGGQAVRAADERSTEFKRFQAVTGKLVQVPKREIDEQRKKKKP